MEAGTQGDTYEPPFLGRSGIVERFELDAPPHDPTSKPYYVTGPRFVEPFRVELDGSELLRAMIRRKAELLEELGAPDATGDTLIAALLKIETETFPVFEAAEEWLREVGPPEVEEFDTYEFNPDEAWTKARW